MWRDAPRSFTYEERGRWGHDDRAKDAGCQDPLIALAKGVRELLQPNQLPIVGHWAAQPARDRAARSHRDKCIHESLAQ